MALYGIGAYYKESVYQDFIDNDCVCIGWKIKTAPSLFSILTTIEVTDLVYIKSYRHGLCIKAIGIVIDSNLIDFKELGKGVKVKWLWQGKEKIPKSYLDKYNVYSNTIYKEYNEKIKAKIISLLSSA